MTTTYPTFLIPILLIISFIHISFETADTRCFKIPLIKNFDIEKIAGDWYGQEIGDLDGDESSKRCLHYYTRTDKNENGTTLIGFRIFNGTSSIGNVEMFKTHQVGNTSEFYVEWKERQGSPSGWLIGTDYKSWSAWYLCHPEQVDKGDMFISTRVRNASESTLEKARKVVRKVGFKLTKPYFKRITQTNCFN